MRRSRLALRRDVPALIILLILATVAGGSGPGSGSGGGVGGLGDGGALFVNQSADVTLSGVVLANNKAVGGAGGAGLNGGGGGGLGTATVATRVMPAAAYSATVVTYRCYKHPREKLSREYCGAGTFDPRFRDPLRFPAGAG